MSKKYKVLAYGNHIYVDETKLYKGIYTTELPKLHQFETTISSLIEAYELMEDMIQGFNSENYVKNLEQCNLINVTLTYSKL